MSRVCLIFVWSFMSFAGLCFSSNTKDIENMSKAPVNQNPIVLFKTSLGDIKVDLYADKAPITVENFLRYVNEGHYNHTIFHRVIDGFMVQGGGFSKDMQQKPTHATIKNEAENGLLNKRGTLAMARTSDVNSASSQFFINVADNAFLDFRAKTAREYGYCVFGAVTDGMDIVNKIKNVKTGTKGPFENVPVESVEIIEAKQIS